MGEPAPGGTIRFTPAADDPVGDGISVVLDTTWTPPPDAVRVIAVRGIAGRILAAHDLIAETSSRLDRWASSSGVVEQLTIRDTSFWFYVRLRHWMWLQERILWAAIADVIAREQRPATIVCAPGVDPALLDVLRLVAARDGIDLCEEPVPEPGPSAEPVPGPAHHTEPKPGSGSHTGPHTGSHTESMRTAPATTTARAKPPPRTEPGSTRPRRSAARRILRRVRNIVLGPPPPSAQRLRQLELQKRVERIRTLVDRLAAEPEARLLVVHEHARQRVETPTGPRSMNPYLDPIVDRLRGTKLEPIVLDIRARAGQDAAWERIGSGLEERVLPADALAIAVAPPPTAGEIPSKTVASAGASAVASAGASAGAAAVSAGSRSGAVPVMPASPSVDPATAPTTVPPIDPRLPAWRAGLDAPMDAFGIDLGPLLATEVAVSASRWLPGMTSSIDRIQRFLERLKPAGIVLADEYHRQDWMVAARATGVPVAAVQHGMIYPLHNGYIHADRPASLRLPQRTFVFGRWERDLLCEASVYHRDEVVAGGSPRLDLVVPDPEAGKRIRRDLGIADNERLVLVSGTWGGIYRRFHYPIALAALVDRPLPGVHFVIKLHPGEPDEGPYRRIIEGAAAARGFAPPRVTTVQSIDLYRLLAAADAHLGIHSTVLTEAVVTRTPNLLAEGLAGADLLGYVAAGVAVPVQDGADLLAALDASAGGLDEDAAAAFSAAHFEPGSASERIAANLEAWL